MTRNEIILSNKINFSDITSGKIDHIIRIGEKNKWTPSSVFCLKSSHTSHDHIPISILSSEKIPVSQISSSLLIRCGYNSQSHFQTQWEDWFQTWDDTSTAWLIHFELHTPLKDAITPEDFAELFA